MYQGMNLDEQDEPVMMVWARVASYQTNIDLNTRDQLIWTNLYFVLHHKYPSQDLTPLPHPCRSVKTPRWKIETLLFRKQCRIQESKLVLIFSFQC